MTTVRPERGTRPANRRALIVEAATELFCDRGYEHVSMGDIATAVGVGPSALYRHFPGKRDLLVDVVRAAIDPIRESVTSLDLHDRPASPRALAALGLHHWRTELIWQREARHLSPEQRRALRIDVNSMVASLAERVGAVRDDVGQPEQDLIAMAILSSVFSPAFDRVRRSRAVHEALMASIAERVLDARFRALGRTRAAVPALHHRSRREVVLAQAVRLFAIRGYASVSVEGLAGSLGMAGPSVYNHFPSKADLLDVPLRRAEGYLMTQLAEVLASTPGPAPALRCLIGAYARFAFAHHHIVDLLISEIRNLTDDRRQEAATSQREYVAEWVHLMLQVHPDMGRTNARTHVRAVITVINNASRTTRVRTAENGERAVVDVGAHILGLDP